MLGFLFIFNVFFEQVFFCELVGIANVFTETGLFTTLSRYRIEISFSIVIKFFQYNNQFLFCHNKIG